MMDFFVVGVIDMKRLLVVLKLFLNFIIVLGNFCFLFGFYLEGIFRVKLFLVKGVNLVEILGVLKILVVYSEKI